MKTGNIGGLTNKLSEIPRRLKQFVTDDVRRNPILGLYLVIGVMVVGYAIYFVVVLYKDFSSKEEKRVASKQNVGQVEKARRSPKPAPPKKKIDVSEPAKDSGKQVTPTQAEPEEKEVAEKPIPPDGEKLEVGNWNKHEFKDGSRISFPADWSSSEIPPEKNIMHGIRLQDPNTEASVNCYGRARQPGVDIAKSLKKTMSNGGYGKVSEQKKKVNNLDVLQLSGKLADKRMVVSIFDDRGGKYFIVSLVASETDYRKMQPYYDSVVESYEGAKTSAVSITKIEEELERSIEADKEYLVGAAVRIKLRNGSRHQGVVIAENDDSITLESYRFGGRYSFAVKKKDIVEVVR
jgi:hypothetical protein